MTFEINDQARGTRKILALPSLTTWDDLQDRVSQIFNVHPGSLQLQYRFSNEKNNSLPFDLHTHDEYTVMRDQLRPLVVPKVLSNGKLSKSVRKPVSVQLFNKGTQAGGVFIEKGIKVSTVTTVAELIIYILLIQKSSKPPGNVDASQQKVDEHLEKKISIIEQLTKYWRCEVHSLPDKPALCWIPTDQRPYGNCYPITQNNINFWATCVVSFWYHHHLSMSVNIFRSGIPPSIR